MRKTMKGSKAAISAPALLSADQVAALLQVSTRTVWRLLSSGELIQPVRMRGSTRWRRAELEAWIESGCPRVESVRE